MRIKCQAFFLRKMLTAISAAAILAPLSGALAQDDAVDEVIVTVERREQSLQDYAGTAAQISGDDLKKLGIANMTDLDGAIPGLNITNNSGNIEVWIRGVGSSNNTELGDPAAATHMNGVYIPALLVLVPHFSIFNVLRSISGRKALFAAAMQWLAQ